MKKKIFFLMTFPFVFLVSCDQMLDTPNDGRIQMKEIFMSLSRTRDYVSSCYNYLPSLGGFYNDATLLASYSDEAQDAKDHANGSIQAWYEGRMSSTQNLLGNGYISWSRFWLGISKCNTFMQNINDTVNMKTLYLTIIERKSMIAQVRTLRAFYYLELIKRFGGVPIMSGRYGIDQDLSLEKRASFAKCVDYIIADCDSALNCPDVDAGINNGFRWRAISDSELQNFTRATACAIKSRAALYAASPLWANDNLGATEPYTWDKAAKITKEALDLCLVNGYKLYTLRTTNAQNGYASYFLAAMKVSGPDKESIYQSSTRCSLWGYQGLPINKGQTKAGACPTQELVDAYEVYDKTSGNSVPLLNLEDPYLGGDHTKPNFNPQALAAPYNYSETSAQTMYLKRDPRFLASIYRDGSYRGPTETGSVISTRIGGDCEISEDINNQRNTRTGYYIRKGNDYRSNLDNDQDGFLPIFRLAELYMNFAEAAYNSSSGVTGTILSSVSGVPTATAANTALSAVNRIRVRAGLKGLTSTITKEEFELRYRNERRIEFAFEEFRFFDVRRWQNPDGYLDATDKVVSGMRISSDGSSFTRFTFAPRNTYENKYLKMPIDFEEIARVYDFTGIDWQNPGW